MANKTGYTGAIDSDGVPILTSLLDSGDGTFALKVSGLEPAQSTALVLEGTTTAIVLEGTTTAIILEI
jgi:hypothetical protein